MAIPTPVNGQITDAITQSNVTVLGQSPSMALGNLLQVSAQSFAMMMQNASAAQQNLNISAQAATTSGVSMLYGAAAAATSKIASSDVPDNLLSLLAALRAGTGPIPS